MRKHRAKRQIYVPYNGKIADITHADTNKHFLDLATALSETRQIIMIQINADRQAGSGYMYVYPNEGANGVNTGDWTPPAGYQECVIIAAGTNRLQYALGVANDDFDVFCYGYVVEV